MRKLHKNKCGISQSKRRVVWAIKGRELSCAIFGVDLRSDLSFKCLLSGMSNPLNFKMLSHPQSPFCRRNIFSEVSYYTILSKVSFLLLRGCGLWLLNGSRVAIKIS